MSGVAGRENKILAALRETGQPARESLHEPPTLGGFGIYWYAFDSLLGEPREPGGPIPWTAVHAMAQYHGLETDELARILRPLTRRLDEAKASRHDRKGHSSNDRRGAGA